MAVGPDRERHPPSELEVWRPTVLARAHSRYAAVCVLVGVCAMLAACGAATSRSAGQPLSHAAATDGGAGGAPLARTGVPFRFFSPTSFWNTVVPANAPLDPNSTPIVHTFDEEIAREEQVGNGPWINTTKYSVPVYTVPARQPTVSVRLTGTSEATLSAAWRHVPLPANAQPAIGTDGDLVVWQPSTDRLWEFWRLARSRRGWRASWGGAMRHVSKNSGVYGSHVWPGAQPGWGVSASSLSLVGGLISIEDLEIGQINHALALSVPGVRAGYYSIPAQRTDGNSTAPLSLPEGAHLRLNPSLDLATLHLPHLTLMLAEAAQHYGIFVTDGTGSSGVSQFSAQDPAPTGANPYLAVNGFFEGKSPRALLTSFPWNQLELLKMELHKKRPWPHHRVIGG